MRCLLAGLLDAHDIFTCATSFLLHNKLFLRKKNDILLFHIFHIEYDIDYGIMEYTYRIYSIVFVWNTGISPWNMRIQSRDWEFQLECGNTMEYMLNIYSTFPRIF